MSPCECVGGIRQAGFEVREQHPKPQPIECPDHVPDRIAANFREAAGNVRAGAFTSAVMMFRKVIDRATRGLGAESPDRMPLSARIAALAEQQVLTPAMRDWAHLIRLDGNEAAHDEDSDKATAQQIEQFTELFLIYAFTLPERVRAYREQAPC